MLRRENALRLASSRRFAFSRPEPCEKCGRGTAWGGRYNGGMNETTGWLASAHARRARRALERQLDYQVAKAAKIRGYEDAIAEGMRTASERVRNRIAAIRPFKPAMRVLEVGSGAHGLIFSFEGRQRVGVDPLAVEYAQLFPWQRRASTVAAAGERLPFRNDAFDIVLCDNVVDHAEGPRKIVEEMARVLAPGGILYFTVNVHHPIYGLASHLHGAWNAVGLPIGSAYAVALPTLACAFAAVIALRDTRRGISALAEVEAEGQ